jgi:cephalosporin hydroxylase
MVVTVITVVDGCYCTVSDTVVDGNDIGVTQRKSGI